MKFRELLKEVENDRKHRKVAKNIYEKMLEYLESGGDVRINPSRDVEEFNLCINLSDFYPSMMSEYYPLDICFYNQFRKSDKALFKWRGIDGSVIEMYHVDFEILFQNLEMGSKLTKDKMKTDSFRKEASKRVVSDFELTPDLRNTFFEELHHYLDYVRTEGDISFGNEGDYYKKDTEFNAKLQSAINSFETEVLNWGSINSRREFQEEWKEDFESFKDWFIEHMLSKEFVSSLNKSRYKRVVNRLYKFWEDSVSF